MSELDQEAEHLGRTPSSRRHPTGVDSEAPARSDALIRIADAGKVFDLARNRLLVEAPSRRAVCTPRAAARRGISTKDRDGCLRAVARFTERADGGDQDDYAVSQPADPRRRRDPRRYSVSRSCLENPSSPARCFRTMSPSRISTRLPNALSRGAKASAIAVLPAPESPVSHRTTPSSSLDIPTCLLHQTTMPRGSRPHDVAQGGTKARRGPSLYDTKWPRPCRTAQHSRLLQPMTKT